MAETRSVSSRSRWAQNTAHVESFDARIGTHHLWPMNGYVISQLESGGKSGVFAKEASEYSGSELSEGARLVHGGFPRKFDGGN
jgi:hypothetical protein